MCIDPVVVALAMGCYGGMAFLIGVFIGRNMHG